MSERPVPSLNLSHLPTEMIVAILKRLPTQHVWTEVSQTWKWMRDLVRDHHFSQQQTLTLVVHYRTPIEVAEQLVGDAETAIQLEDFFVDGQRSTPLASIRTHHRLSLSWFTRANVTRLIESFTNLRTLQIVIYSQADFTQERFLVELLRAWTTKLTSFKLWIRTPRAIDPIPNQPVSRLTNVWPVVSLMLELKQLTLEVQQNGGLNPATRLALDQHVPDFQVELTNLVQLERFSFGSADRSTTVWNSLVAAQNSENLRVVEYGGPIIVTTQVDDALPNMVRPAFARERIQQIGVHVDQMDPLRTFCLGLPQLRKLFVSAPELNESALVAMISQANLRHLTDLRLYFRADQSTHSPFRQLGRPLVDWAMPTVRSLTMGHLPFVQRPHRYYLARLDAIFPGLQCLTLAIDDNAIRPRRQRNFYRQIHLEARTTLARRLRAFRMEFIVAGSFRDYAH